MLIEYSLAAVPIILLSLLLTILVWLSLDTVVYLNDVFRGIGVFVLEVRNFGFVFHTAYHNSLPSALVAFPYLFGLVPLFAASGIGLLNRFVLCSAFILPLFRSMVIGVVLIFLIKKRLYVFVLTPFLLVALVASAYLGGIMDRQIIFDLSTLTKLSLLGDYIILFDDPWTALFGQGLGHMHSWGTTPVREAFIVEFTYFEILRFFGIPLGLLLLAIFSYPFCLSLRSSVMQSTRIGLLALIAVSFWNPYIWGTAGMVPIGLFVGVALREKHLQTDLT